MASDEPVVSMSEVVALKKRVAELERVLGKKTLENEILKSAVEIARKKTDLARALVRDRGFPVKDVAKALPYHEVIYMKGLNWRPKSVDHIQKIDDEELLPYIIAIVDSRPTYGYRRVGAFA